MKKSSPLFIFFLCILFFYFWRNITFWMSTIIYGIEERDILLYISIAILWCISLFYILSYRKHIGRSSVHKIAFVWFICMPVVLLYNKSPLSAYLKCMLWPLLFEATYICTLLYKSSQKLYLRLFKILTVMGGIYFFQSLVVKGFERASNMVYFAILTFPLILATKKNNKKFFLIPLLASFLALISLKRSMILALLLYWVIYFAVYLFKRKKIIQSIILVILMSAAAVYSYNYVDDFSGGGISRRMENEDVTNGREEIYDLTWLMIENSSTGHKLLGNGHNAVRLDSILEVSAHNEWLEMIYDYGYFMLFLYSLLWLYMIRKWWRLFKDNSPYFYSMTLCICIWAVMSMVSQLMLYMSYVIYLFMFLAYVDAKTQKKIS